MTFLPRSNIRCIVEFASKKTYSFTQNVNLSLLIFRTTKETNVGRVA